MNKYYNQDITFCSRRQCKNKKCERHQSHADCTIKPFHSFADFKNTRYCPIHIPGMKINWEEKRNEQM